MKKSLGAKRNSKRGFTLAELLIVVAIIAVLTAIAIPVFAAELEKSREATDLANIRSAYAEMTAMGIANDKTSASGVNDPIIVNLKQTQEGWQTEGAATTIKELDSTVDDDAKPTSGGTATISWVASTADKPGHCTIVYGT